MSLAPVTFGAGLRTRNESARPLTATTTSSSLAINSALPQITATKRDAFPDPDTDGKAVPGDTITYTVEIRNNGGTDLTGVVFSDPLDPNTSLVPGSISTTPVAVNDNYSAIGNVQISVNAAAGLLANDSDPDGNTLTASAAATSAQGGNVSVNPDGSFTYNPPAGFEGTDSFTYSVTDGNSPADSATVTVNVGGMVWFVNSNAPSGGDGRLTSPFNALTGAGSFDAVAADEQNDSIFLYSGSYAGGFTLQSGQLLIGQGASASLASIAGLTPPSYSLSLPATGGPSPTITGAGLTVANNNLIRGLTVANTSGTGIAGSGFGTLAVSEVSVNSTGQALSFDNGQLNASFDSISSTGAPAAAINLTNLSANSVFSGGLTTVDNAGGVGIEISNITSNATINFGDTSVTNRHATGIDLNAVSGTIGFGDTLITNPVAAGGYGIRVLNSDASVSFLKANISNSKQTLAQTDADANLIPDNDGDGDAIFLKNNTGSFTVSGGTLSTCGNDCIDVRNSANLSLLGVTIEKPGQDVTAASASGTGGHAIQAINLTGANSITGSVITQFNLTGRDGLRFINTDSTPSTMTIDSTHFTNATGNNGILVTGRDAAQMDVTVQNNCLFTGLTGPAITHNGGENTNSTATVNLTVKGSSFTNAASNGLNTISAHNDNGGKATVLIEDNTFDNVARVASSNTGVITVNGDGLLASNSLGVTIRRNTINNIGTATLAGFRGIQVFIDDATRVAGTIVIDHNTLTSIRRDGIFLDLANGIGGGGSNLAARLTDNVVGTDGGRVGLAGQSGIRVFGRRLTSLTRNVLISGNSVRNGNGTATSALNAPGLFVRAEDSSSMSATVTNNNIESSTGAGVAEVHAATNNASATLCLDINGNTIAANAGLIFLNEQVGTLNVKQTSTSDVASANGIPAGNVTVAGTPQFGVTCAAPPVALLRTEGSQYLAAVQGDAAPAALQASLPTQVASVGGSSRKDGSKWLSALLGQAEAPAWLSQLKNSVTFSYSEKGMRLGLGDAQTAQLSAAASASALTAYSSDTISLNIGTLPAGKSMTITFKATINNNINTTQVANQGTVSGSNFSSILTDDPDTGLANDPTVTPVGAPPVISCPADINVGNDPGQASAVVSFNVTAAGSPNPTVTCKVGSTVIASPYSFPLGETTVSCTATNSIGADSCSFKVKVNDTQAPTIACPANITTGTEPGACSANVNPGTPTVNDNDPNVSVTGTRSDGLPLNAAYPKGTTTITWTATDTAGNTASCQQIVTVTDNEAPTLSVSNVVVSAAADSCSAIVNFSPTANDNCPGVNVTTSIPSGSAFNVGTTTVTATATDAAGNTTTRTFTVTVNDTTAPAISCPANIVVPLAPNSVTAPVNFSVGATDNCAGVNVTTSHASGSLFPVGTTTVTATATDTAGNSSQCSFSVTVLYNFTGFFAPVANLPSANVVKAGQAVPVKFSLSGYKGMNIFAAGSPASGVIACGSTGDSNVIEETITAGSSSLSYDAATDQYTYIWKTDKAWKDTCRQLVIQLADGSFHRANFQFK